MRASTSRLALAASAAVLTLALAGCADEREGDPAPTTSLPSVTADPTSSPSSTLAPTASPTPAPPTIMPACDALIPLEQARQLSGIDMLEAFHDRQDLRDAYLAHEFGPVAADAFTNAEQAQYCLWAPPNSDNITAVFTAVLSIESKTALTAALDDSSFVRSETGDTVLYTQEDQMGLGPWFTWYALHDNVWVVEFGNVSTPIFGQAALDAILAAN